MARKFRFNLGTIRSRLLVGFVFIALLPALGISAGSVLVGSIYGRYQTLNQLESVAQVRDLKIQAWLYSLQQTLSAAKNEEFASERASIILQFASQDKFYNYYTGAMRSRLRLHVAQSNEFTDISLINLKGEVVLSSDPSLEGQVFGDSPAELRGLTGASLQQIYSGSPQRLSAVIVLLPITSAEGANLGAIAGRTSLAELEQILADKTGLGKTGKTYLVNDSAELVTQPQFVAEDSQVGLKLPAGITAGVETVVNSRGRSSGLYTDLRGARVIGSYQWLPDLGMVLFTEQDLSEAFWTISLILGVNVAIAVIAVLLAVLGSLAITRSIASPIEGLVQKATQIAAGDLEQIAVVERPDEVGVLAQAFNSMTGRLRDLINSLEKRVDERTLALSKANEDLSRRAVQLETNAQVSQEITSILDIDQLLAQVVSLMRQSFGYYRIHIYLLDPLDKELVLRASSGEPAPYARRIALGQGSLNGEAAQANIALLSNDVASDTRFLSDAHLPDTRAELVIPLRVGEQLIGTLDVQSSQVNAFAQEDLLVIQSLGDQIAIAIENARLYERSRELAVFEERNRLARELHDSVTQSLYSLWLLAEGWRRLAASGGGDLPVKEAMVQVGEVAQQALKEMRLLVYELRPPEVKQEGLLGAVAQRLESVESRAGIATSLQVDEFVQLPTAQEDLLYRIIQEALNNILKHSSATRVEVCLSKQDNQVALVVRDNGRGFDPEETRTLGGIGLVSMRERAAQMGGALTIESSPGKGTSVQVLIPFAESAPEDVQNDIQKDLLPAGQGEP